MKKQILTKQDIQKELLSIKKEIEFLYGKDNIGKVTNELSALKTAEREQHRNDIMQMYEDQTISHINISPHENHDVHEFDCFDDFKEFIDKMHRDDILVWANSIVFSHKVQLAGGHSDDTSLTESEEEGWGWIADRGFDMIQTDWPGMLIDYLKKTDRYYK